MFITSRRRNEFNIITVFHARREHETEHAQWVAFRDVKISHARWQPEKSFTVFKWNQFYYGGIKSYKKLFASFNNWLKVIFERSCKFYSVRLYYYDRSNWLCPQDKYPVWNGRSLMQIRNNIGPRTEPWGWSALMWNDLERWNFNTTFDTWYDMNDWIVKYWFRCILAFDVLEKATIRNAAKRLWNI